MPGAASRRRSRTTRWAARSRVVQPSQRVGASGPAARMDSTSAARSRRATLIKATLEGFHPFDSDDHSVSTALIADAGAVLARVDGPAHRAVLAIVEGDHRNVTEVSDDPLDLAVRGEP